MEWENVAARGWALPGYGNEAGADPLTPNVPTATAISQNLVSPTTPYMITNRYITREEPSPLGPHVSRRTGEAVTLESVPQSRRFQRVVEDRSRTSQLLEVSPAQRKWQEGHESDAVVRLPTRAPSIQQLLRRDTKSLELAANLSHSDGREKFLDKISQSTGTFIKQEPGRCLRIWGDADSVAKTKKILQGLVDPFYEKTEKNAPDARGHWLKIHPSGTTEVVEKKARIGRAMREAESELREEPKSGQIKNKASNYRCMFIWPQDGPTLQESFGDKLEALDSIRKAFKVHVYLQKDVDDCITVCGSEETNMSFIAKQLREKWKAAVAKADIRIKVYLVELPKGSTMQSQVKIVKKKRFALPILHQRVPRSSPTTRKEEETITHFQQKNDEILLRSFQKALSKAHFFAGRLRMRIHFGSFLMDHYRKPKDGESLYSLEEFQEMIMNERAIGRLVPGLKLSGEELLSRCLSASSLLESTSPLSTLSGIKTTFPTYSANFEFSGKTESQFRLEVDFKHRSLELEQQRHRWFKVHEEAENPRRLVLQAGVMDFARCDWQGDIELFEPLNDDDIQVNLTEFLKTVRFDNRIHVHGMALVPRRKVLFDWKAPVASFVEKASVQLKIKGTSYVLEVARFDRYTSTSSGWERTASPTVTWGATLFDPYWDIVLGSGLNMEGNAPRRPEKYMGNFRSLFPPRANMSPDNDEGGFWDLIGFVDKVSELLSATKDVREGPSSDLDKDINPELLDVELGTLF
ncbi:hypothetical protein N7478_005151 [Penicillium angulare]|uniref:uncharacterized protein n=1 Tax=Penicillium angulare TaxID=116970 RepID=UPI00254230F3|nr:uncharacterized protein N7478_005151 [Penicillium angulare]KAJ5279779.1 hypothetical protein N7478_005151 [Penicillium angulare]